MSTDLFPIPYTPEPRLTTARKRLEAAEKAYERAWISDEECDGLGLIPDEINHELAAARSELARAEAERMRL